MKKILSAIFIVMITAMCARASYGATLTVKILSLDTTTKNAVIDYNSKDILLHYKGNCTLKEGADAKITISGELNANGDTIFTDNYYQCTIDQAEEVNGRLTLDQVFYNYSAIATDENGKQYDISYDARCLSIARYWRSEVYLYKAGSKIAVADEMFLPRNEGSCSITYIHERPASTSTPKTTGDTQKPTSVSSLTATPGNTSVYLNWRAASDNTGVDHYVISYSTSGIDTKEYGVNDMPNKIETAKTSYTVTGLMNEETYFFYVAAVDAAGNTSSDWSPEAIARPLSSISKIPTSTTKNQIVISKKLETDTSITFKWTSIAAISRQTVILAVNGTRDFAFTSWTGNDIKISKSIYRKGKSLKLTVRQYDIRGQMFESSFSFSF
jgi:hypothetical protein